MGSDQMAQAEAAAAMERLLAGSWVAVALRAPFRDIQMDKPVDRQRFMPRLAGRLSAIARDRCAVRGC
jgi:hypothetical protein